MEMKTHKITFGSFREKEEPKRESETFFIQPMNEGQELNYIETFEGTLSDADARAKEMKTGLQNVLQKGSISVEILNKAGEKLKQVV